MFRRFGSRVTVIQRGKQLLSKEDDDVAKAVAEILTQDGIEVLLETSTVRVEQPSEGEIKLTVRTRNEERTLKGSHLLVAIGRTPNTDRLHPERSGASRPTTKATYL